MEVDGIATGVLEVTDYRPVEEREEEEVATRAGVMELVRKKDELEVELRRLHAVLAGEGVGLGVGHFVVDTNQNYHLF